MVNAQRIAKVKIYIKFLKEINDDVPLLYASIAKQLRKLEDREEYKLLGKDRAIYVTIRAIKKVLEDSPFCVDGVYDFSDQDALANYYLDWYRRKHTVS